LFIAKKYKQDHRVKTCASYYAFNYWKSIFSKRLPTPLYKDGLKTDKGLVRWNRFREPTQLFFTWKRASYL